MHSLQHVAEDTIVLGGHEMSKKGWMIHMGKRRGKGEGSIYRRQDGRWAAEITIEGRRRKTLYGRTREEVREKLFVAQHEKRQGLLRTGPRQTVKDYLNYWLDDIHRTEIKLSTYALYRHHLDKHLIPALGHIQLQKLTADQVQAFCAQKLRENLSTGVVRLQFTILSLALKDAVKRKRLAVNVCDVVTIPRLIKHAWQFLNREQAFHLLEAAKGSRLDCLLTVALTTGMRLGELLALRWDDIDMDRCLVQVRHSVRYIQGFGVRESEPKTERSKGSITLPQFVIDALKQHHTSQLEARLKAGATWQEQGLVFPNMYGRYLNRTKLYSLFNKVLKEAGLPHIRFHDLRHSTATLLLSMGVPAKVVQEILRHSNIGTTLNTYAHVLPEMHREAMDKMDNFFSSRKWTSEN
jgi:integrase